MFERLGQQRDPFEGTEERSRRIRVEVEGIVAIALAVVACGLTAGMWLHTLAPLVDQIALS